MAGAVYELAIKGTCPGGGSFVNTHHFWRAEESGEEGALYDDWATSCKDAYRAVLTTEYTLAEVTVRQVEHFGGTRLVASHFPIAEAGTQSHPSYQNLADWLSCRITWYTALAGRRHRAANLIPGGTEGDVDGNDLNVGAGFWHSRVADYAQALLGTFDDGYASGQLEAFSRYEWEHGHPDPTDAITPITSYVVQPTLRSSRSRRPR